MIEEQGLGSTLPLCVLFPCTCFLFFGLYSIPEADTSRFEHVGGYLSDLTVRTAYLFYRRVPACIF